jgi:hypothetical protein
MATDIDKRFIAMSERILRNDYGAKFGGACVIVPPEGGGDPIEFLVLDEAADPAQFWSTIMSRIQIVVQKLDSQRGMYGR